MRCFVLASLALLFTADPAAGQVRTSARTSIEPDITIPVYKVTRKDGTIYYFVSYTKKESWYHFVDIYSKKSAQLIDSVRSIEKLTPAEAQSIADKKPTYADGTPAVRGEILRTHARIQARTRAAASRSVNSYPSYDFYSPMSAGYTPTGIPMHVGPRGGIYHISSGGNKVYHSH